jgi:hypothetical protein
VSQNLLDEANLFLKANKGDESVSITADIKYDQTPHFINRSENTFQLRKIFIGPALN